MKNIVELEYDGKTYKAYNDIHIEFYNAILNLFAYGRYPDSEQFSSITRLLSLHPNFSGNSQYDLGAGVKALSSVAIFAFTEPDSALRFKNSSISAEDIIRLGSTTAEGKGKTVSYYDLYNNNTYSLTSLGNKSFSVSQTFFYSPTGESTFFVYDIKSFGLKTNYLRRQLPIFLPEYLPFAHITTKKLTGKESIKLNPTESFKVTWVVDFDIDTLEESTSLRSTINGADARIHEQLRIIISNIMSSSSYVYPSTTSDFASYFKIEGIIAFKEPTGALYNNGLTSTGTAFFMTPDDSILASNISITGNNTISYFVSYTNNTGQPQQIGSLLLSGERNSEVFSIVPIAWISAKDLWGVEKRIVQPKERLEITWTIKLSTSKILMESQQQSE